MLHTGIRSCSHEYQKSLFSTLDKVFPALSMDECFTGCHKLSGCPLHSPFVCLSIDTSHKIFLKMSSQQGHHSYFCLFV